MRTKSSVLIAVAIVLGIAGAAFGRDVIFFVAADLHYGQEQLENNEGPNKNAIAIMNNLPGTAFPDKNFGVVAKPRGVLVAGDLTDSGKGVNYDGKYLDIHVFDGFVDDYPVKGGAGVHIHFPVYEGYGNHDVQKQTGDAVLKGIALRNKNRDAPVNVSDNGPHYSWDWDDVHFVNVNVYAGGKGDARDSLSFLQKDLADRVGTSGRPVVIMQHYGFDKLSIEDRWWKQDERDAFYNVIKKYNVVAIFSGHEHLCHRVIWNGIADFVAPLAKGDKGGDGIFAVRMFDNKMIVAQRRLDGTWGDVWTEDLPAPAH
jgi:cytolysin (calcineurin-like family phosphatase)